MAIYKGSITICVLDKGQALGLAMAHGQLQEPAAVRTHVHAAEASTSQSQVLTIYTRTSAFCSSDEFSMQKKFAVVPLLLQRPQNTLVELACWRANCLLMPTQPCNFTYRRHLQTLVGAIAQLVTPTLVPA